ncbi:MAG TPA: LPS assembly lipoprotein LptE [Vicinamibacterales bacterium]|nr:LPS assembly lipoprotein LptE [Vicinamibacterales bacterium]
MSASGCGYSLSGRGSFLPSYIKTIGVPSFTNHTNVFNFETQLTQKVRSEFIGRGKYQIVPDDTGVDAVLIGDIVSATVVPVSLTTTGLQSGAAVTVTANVQLKSLRDNTIIWQNAALSIREQYDTQNATNATDPSAFFAQNATALDRLSSNFARTIVSGILEAF